MSPETNEPDEPVDETANSEESTGSLEKYALQPVALVQKIACWRCGLLTELVVQCVHCHATLVRSETAISRRRITTEKSPHLLRLLFAYFITLCVSLAWAMYLHSSDTLTNAQRETGIIVVECIDLVITLSLFFFLGRIVLPKPAEWIRFSFWIIAPTVSVGLYLITHWYVEVLRRYVNLDWLYVRSHMEFSLLMVILVAVQPAVVEELFFRYFAYGTLRQLMNVHAAVVLSAMMFALAHLHNPLGLPFLFLMGLSLGYARAGSGGVLLPMLMHFGHNLAVLYFES